MPSPSGAIAWSMVGGDSGVGGCSVAGVPKCCLGGVSGIDLGIILLYAFGLSEASRFDGGGVIVLGGAWVGGGGIEGTCG